MFIGTHHPRFEKLRRSEMFFRQQNIIWKNANVTPTEFKNPQKRIFYKHFTPNGVRQKFSINHGVSISACKI